MGFKRASRSFAASGSCRRQSGSGADHCAGQKNNNSDSAQTCWQTANEWELFSCAGCAMRVNQLLLFVFNQAAANRSTAQTSEDHPTESSSC
eukprot:scaffold1355_cov154-Ochromonas_danica.AAC.11